MHRIEKYIIDNREKFDLEEPDEGHFDRFMDRQVENRKNTARFTWKHMLQAAAVTILLVMSSLWVYERFTGDELDNGFITLAEIDPEYREAELYYTSLINHKYNEIRSFDFPDNADEREMILKELAEMDTIYRSLEEELNTEGGNPMIINAMIQHYQLKVNIMNQILDHLHQVHNAEESKIYETSSVNNYSTNKHA
ncbi:MAG: hypothetical protein ACLFQA_07115 [Bacteroidales bacterium]